MQATEIDTLALSDVVLIDGVYYLDGEGSVLCAWCALESQDDFVPHFRPESGPHINYDAIDCDQCNEPIEVEVA